MAGRVRCRGGVKLVGGANGANKGPFTTSNNAASGNIINAKGAPICTKRTRGAWLETSAQGQFIAH